MRIVDRGLRIGVLSVVFLLIGVGASADTTGLFYGLYATNSSGTVVSELDFTSTAYNKNRRIVSDPIGDRQQIQHRFRDRIPGNGRPSYTRVDFYDNGYYCLPASHVSVSGGPKGQSGVTYSSSAGCSSGWNWNGTYSSDHFGDGQWHYWNMWQFFIPTADAGKGVVKTCQDNPLWFTDDCSGPRTLGADF